MKFQNRALGCSASRQFFYRHPGALIGILFLLLVIFPGGASATAKGEGIPSGNPSDSGTLEQSEYTIERGDVLSIAVWQNQDLTRTVTVLPNGKIIFPLVGTVLAAGRSLSEFEHEMAERLRKYVPDLVFTVNVEQARSMVIYVIGKVNRPGEFTISGEVDILQALAMAGGLNEFAKSDRIKLFRRKSNKTEIFDFDYGQVSKGDNLASNIFVQRGDTLVIP